MRYIILLTTVEKGRIIMAKNDRFQVILTEGNGLTSDQRIVLLDTTTGVQYLFVLVLCAAADLRRH